MPVQKPLKIGSDGLHEQFGASDTLGIIHVPLASQGEAEAGIVNDKVMTPLRTAQAISALGGGGGGTTEEFAITMAIALG
jgi:hypothetical protein